MQEGSFLMKDALTKLIKVKTLVTLILTIVFAVLCLVGRVDPQQFLTIFAVIISFYFGTVAEKSVNAKEVASSTATAAEDNTTNAQNDTIDYSLYENNITEDEPQDTGEKEDTDSEDNA